MVLDNRAFPSPESTLDVPTSTTTGIAGATLPAESTNTAGGVPTIAPVSQSTVPFPTATAIETATSSPGSSSSNRGLSSGAKIGKTSLANRSPNLKLTICHRPRSRNRCRRSSYNRSNRPPLPLPSTTQQQNPSQIPPSTTIRPLHGRSNPTTPTISRNRSRTSKQRPSSAL